MSTQDELEFVSVGNADDSAGASWTPNEGFQDKSAAAPGPGGQPSGLGFIRSARHPMAAFFHVLFKGLALFLYTFANWFGLGSSFILVAIMCILLLAADFWTVKNVSGRLLVGLRWWNMIKADGSTEWLYESLDNMSEVDPNDARIFWWSLYATPVAWAVLFVLSLVRLNFQWLLIVCVALALNGANIFGYIRCSRDAQRRMNNFVQDSAVGGVMNNFANSAVSGFMMSALGVNNQQGQQQQNQARQGEAAAFV